MDYFVELGFAPKLASLELFTYLATLRVKSKKEALTPRLLLLSTNHPLDLDQAIADLGGTVRIAPLLARTQPQRLHDALERLLADTATSNRPFALIPIGVDLDQKKLSEDIKSRLAKQGHSSRFILPKHQFIAPIQLSSQNVQEFILVFSKAAVSVYRTAVVSPVIAWQTRDRNRPALDPRSGILPPKVARILVNLALTSPPATSTRIFDPFCGSGTILMEALLRGTSALGSDISETAVATTTANLDWLKQRQSIPGSFRIFTQDVLRLNSQDLPEPISAIVTETDLGPSHKMSLSEIDRTVGRLETFYAQALPRLFAVVPKPHRMVIALPKFNTKRSVKSLTGLIDTCENTGYTRLVGPISYAKPKAQVKRAIIVFQAK